MTRLRLDLPFVRARRIERDLSIRTVAPALGLSEPGWRRVEDGDTDANLSLAQVGTLADLLGVHPAELLVATDRPTAPAAGVDSTLTQRVGALLLVAGRAVPMATLADMLGATSDAVAAAVQALTAQLEPAGLVVSVGKPGVTIVPAALSLRDAAVRDALRVGDLRGALPGPAARMLHRIARGEPLPQAPKRQERLRLQVLLRGGWLTVPVGRHSTARALLVHPDVRFSLALDDGHQLRTATATVHEITRRSRRFPWLDDPEPDVDEDEGR